MPMRSQGPGGQRNGIASTDVAKTPPSGIDPIWRRRSSVCAPGCQACGIAADAASSRPSIAPQRISIPGATISRS